VPSVESAKGRTAWYRERKSVRQQVVAALADVLAGEHGKPAGEKVPLKRAV
jgi:hypothetical protein